MDRMYNDMNEHINDGSFKPTDILQERLEGEAYGYKEDGSVAPPTCSYTPPSDDISSREA